MRLQVVGSHNSLSDRELRGAAHFFARNLFTPETLRKLRITIEFENIGGAYNGFCEYCDRKDRPRQFLIGIRKTLPRKTALRTLAHEVVHAWQYATGHMYDCDGESTKWRGRKFSGKIGYWESPWEIDAFGREVGLCAKFELWHNNRYATSKRRARRSKSK